MLSVSCMVSPTFTLCKAKAIAENGNFALKVQ